MTIERRNMLKEMSAADLRAELIARLREEIRRHETEIERINAQIRQLQPTETVIVRRAIRGTRTLARNEKPLRQVIAQVLKESGEPMTINEIMDAVKATGYRSNATNFRGVISMSLSNTQLFEKSGRGVYVLSPGAVLEDDSDSDSEIDNETDENLGQDDDSAVTAGASDDGEV